MYFTVLWTTLFLIGRSFAVSGCPRADPLRPPIVNHVTPDSLDAAWREAKKRHAAAVQQARSHYPVGDTDSVPDLPPVKEFGIRAPGQLPDFGNELPRSVFVTDPPLLTRDECDDVIQMAEDFFEKKGGWTRQKSGQYEICATWIHDVPALHTWFVRACQTRLFPLLRRQFGDTTLCVDNAYLFKYTPETGGRSDIHTDSGCLSFTIALNGGNEEFTGGGTWFEGLQQLDGHDSNNGADPNVLEMKAGQVTIRPGGVKHAGHALVTGTRYIIGGFCMQPDRVEAVRQLLNPPYSIENLEAALVWNPHLDSVYNILANQYEQAGDKKKAQATLEYCLTHVHRSSGEVAYALGSMYLQQGEHAKAAECMKICLQVDECDIDALITAAETANLLGDTKHEQSLYERVLSTPGATATARGTAYANLGVIHSGTDQEIHFYKQSLKVIPNKYETLYSLAGAYGGQQQYEQAIAVFRKALDQAPDDEQIGIVLKQLYKATSLLIQHNREQFASKEAMVERFQSLMGEGNFNRLAGPSASS